MKNHSTLAEIKVSHHRLFSSNPVRSMMWYLNTFDRPVRYLSEKCYSHTSNQCSFPCITSLPPASAVEVSVCVCPFSLRLTTAYCAKPRSEFIMNMQNRLVHHLLIISTELCCALPKCMSVHNTGRWCTMQVGGAQCSPVPTKQLL